MSKNPRTFEISSNDRSSVIRLPINPKSFEMTESKLNQRVTLANLGEVVMLGNRGLLSGQIASFFPSPHSPFYKYASMTPREYIDSLFKLKNSDAPARLIISDGLNLAVVIDEITQSQNEGDDDIYYTIKLTEYRQLNVPTVAVKSAAQDNGLKQRPSNSNKPASYTVKSQADTLWAWACKVYGNGNKWTDIAKYNGIKDPRSLKLGQVIKLP